MKYLQSCLTLLQIAKVSSSDFDFYFRQDRFPENTLEEIIQENNDRRLYNCLFSFICFIFLWFLALHWKLYVTNPFLICNRFQILLSQIIHHPLDQFISVLPPQNNTALL